MKDHPITTNEYTVMSHWPWSDTSRNTETNISRKKTLNSMSKLIQHSSMKISSKNTQTFSTTLHAKNTYEVKDLKCDTVRIGMINQENVVTLDETIEASNKMDVTLNTEISNDMSSVLLGSDIKEGSSFSDISGQIAGVANNVVDTYGDMIGDVMGVSTNDTKNINADVETNVSRLIENELEKEVNEKNIQIAMTSLLADNTAGISDIVCGNLVSEGVNQSVIVNAVIKKMFSNEVTIKISDNILTKLEDKLESSKQDRGDIAALGTAMAENIDAAGGAAEKLGKGIGEAGRGVGEGVGDAADGVGSGVGKAAEGVGKGLGSATKYLMAAAGLVLCCCICMIVIWLIMSGSTPETVSKAAR